MVKTLSLEETTAPFLKPVKDYIIGNSKLFKGRCREF